MLEDIYKLGIDIGNNLVKIYGDENSEALIFPASLVRYLDVAYMFNDDIDYLEESGFETFSLEANNERKCYIWGNNLHQLGHSVIDTAGTDKRRYANQLYKNLVLFAIGKYVDGLGKSNKIQVYVGMGMPDDEYQATVENEYKSLDWLMGEHTVFVDNVPVEFEVVNFKLMPQESGTLIFYDKTEGHLTPDVRTMVIDYGGMTRLRGVYDGLKQKNNNQDVLGVNQLINALVDRLRKKGVTNKKRNNDIQIQKMLMSQKYTLKTGINTEENFTDIFKDEIRTYSSDRFEEDVYCGEDFENIDLVILTGGGANIVNSEIYKNFARDLWIPQQPETANVKGFYEYVKHEFKREIEKTNKGRDDQIEIGDHIKISELAENEANGYDLKPHRNWEGEIRQIQKTTEGKMLYEVRYVTGEKNVYVERQDLIKINKS